ncbi:rod shape-determining protein MreC [Pandoraea terrae]|uniref:Cell shape-determining protein MreC n=1 Tax=Pandoraea terrae TaxID=1537710 RepID=A0A5E4TAQ9_9BURK|nr:rod shape-determining protein MreC [Pandoraea terrae]VVD84023.1 rod shape-determining protein MreC [Pandoraea terrae]
MQYSPPPLFKQGPSALARLICFVALAIGLLVVDSHYNTLERVRSVVGTALYPVQRLMLLPRDAILGVAGFFATEDHLSTENRILRARNLDLSIQAQRNDQLTTENEHLRQLLSLRGQMPVPSIPAEIEYDTRDPFTQRVVIDRGSKHGVKLGAPVVTEQGLLGQVSRVFLLQSEVTLLTDKDQAVPVQVTRSGVHSVVYGGLRGGVLDLRFIPLSADVKAGDEIATSGLDGIYPAGLPVARIVKVDRVSDTAFARILCQPVAQLRSQRQVLVLQYNAPLALHPDAAADLARASDPSAAGKPVSKGGVRADPRHAPAKKP